jgi:hypothetical protein
LDGTFPDFLSVDRENPDRAATVESHLAQKAAQGWGTRQFLEFIAIHGVISVVVNVGAFTESFEARHGYQFVASGFLRQV